jgi:EAL domain-containing protein (putative c-di-GMP-specific phosphodiesterase class I)
MDREGVVRVVIVDDHEMVLESLVRLVDREPDLVVVATAGTVAEGLEAVQAHRPDVVVMDYKLPDGDGASAARRVMQVQPGALVVMLTGAGEDAAVFAAAEAGCAGFVKKTEAISELVRVIRSVCSGVSEVPANELARLPRLEQLAVYYQPIVDLATRAIKGFEALARWSHPERGILLPAEFLGLAEKTRFVIELDDYVRAQACHDVARWNAQFTKTSGFFVSVNLSGHHFTRPDLPARVAVSLEQSGLEPSRLTIEITETVLVTGVAQNLRVLHELKELGLRIALDDFGTGYSSLGYLRQFPIDVIKLDQSFTEELPDGHRALQLVDAVGRLAADLGAVSEAEGVENEAQLACLRSLGWQLAQGFYFSPPVNAAGIASMLEPA